MPRAEPLSVWAAAAASGGCASTMRSSMMVVCRRNSSRTSRSSRRSPSVMRSRWLLIDDAPACGRRLPRPSSSPTLSWRSPVGPIACSVRYACSRHGEQQHKSLAKRGSRAAFFRTESKQTLTRSAAPQPATGRRRTAAFGPIPAALLAQNGGSHSGGTNLMTRVNKPLTMIKRTLPTRFSSICQTDRMGYGRVAT